MKSIATINFKGGVGKTTITWLLAKYAADVQRKKVLVIDTDAQMSLTLAVHLQDDGAMHPAYQKWEHEHKTHKKTLHDALQQYQAARGGQFDFPIDSNFIYQMNHCLHFIPSTEELYWLEINAFDTQKVKHFVRALLGRIVHSSGYAYDYVFFDCPPNFTVLSLSVLSCANLILIPINPDVFAARGIKLMLDGLRSRIEPWPSPTIGVFMNKATLHGGTLTRETSAYWREAKHVCEIERREGMRVVPFEAYVPDRVGIKRAVAGTGFPDEFAEHFAALWGDVEKASR